MREQSGSAMSGRRQQRHRSQVKGDARDRGEVLVGVITNPSDLEILKTQGWYRIPVLKAQKWISHRWPPNWLAFYHTKAITCEPYGIFYYAAVENIEEARRSELFPHEREKADDLYYKVSLGPLQRLEQPILSRRWRRIVFIRTTWDKFTNATEINDLFDESPLEDRLWVELKRRQIEAERQYFVTVNGHDYALDFAIECKKGKLNVETDGDTWHCDPQRVPEDNRRDNDLELGGWSLLRFNTAQLNEQMVEYCVPTIVKKVEALGGLKDGRVIVRDASHRADSGEQLNLFNPS
jgi:very-short-patch-repair endonuclease